jgi:hypothetical protein
MTRQTILRGVIHESSLPWADERARSLAVYCSDGRLAEHVDELLGKRLDLARCDRLAVPGGPAVLVEHAPCFFEMQGLTRQLQFLVQANQLRRILLIAHEGCAYYQEHLRVAPQDVEANQRKDLQEAAGRVQQLFPGLSVHAMLARVHGERVRFELLEC